MTTIEKTPAGSFAWMELATSDQAAAKRFYTSLFGWEANDSPMGPDAVYTMFFLGGRQAGAAFTMSPQEAAAIPPHWQLYVAVDNADPSARRAEELGAKTVMAPFDVMTFGRMAVLEDPTGAYFSLWQARDHKGMAVVAEPGAFCWADLQTRDREKAMQFYTGLFGWEFLPGKDKDASGYLHIRNGEQYIGGLPAAETLPPHVPPHWLPYIQTADCTGQASTAKGLGAKILLPPTTIEGSLRFSVLSDPQGAVFAFFEPQHA